jgi:RNA polymerase sigma factor (sigma-70 family)
LNSTAKYTEQAIVEGLKQKDRQMFSYVYDNYSAILFGTINNMVADSNTAGDLMQETFIKIWENLDKYDPGKGRLFTWMINIARNHTLDFLRSKAYKQSQVTTSDEQMVDVVQENAATQTLERKALVKEIKKLDENQQKVLQLAYFSSCTQEEIAQLLAIPLGTVKSRIRAALSELRKTINVHQWT